MPSSPPSDAGRPDGAGPPSDAGRPDGAAHPDGDGRAGGLDGDGGPPGPVVLVGMMATGKTTVSRRVAAHLGRALFDSDEMIERRRGRTVAQLWAEGGEPAYRELETEVLEEALSAHPPGVIAAAGGVVLSPGNRARLQRASEDGAVVVWLRADPSVLAGRVRPGDHRPLLQGDPEGTLRRLAAEREELYAEVADRIVDTGAVSVDEVVSAVLDEVAAVGREKQPR